jgi:pimeloyl-ACP methyl ester carboxylesterase
MVRNSVVLRRGSRKVLRKMVRFFAATLLLIVLLVGVGAVYQTVTGFRDRRNNPPPGRLVDVGGYRMHIHCVGGGSPTVILEAGLGETWLTWYKVQPAVGRFARVCSYDRAGMGWSDPSPRPRTSKVIAEELHTLLQRADVAPPFVLVGHSHGGLDIREYADLFRTDVVGMVLVDAVHPDQYDRFPRELRRFNEEFLRRETWKRKTMPFGIPRLLGWCGSGPAEIRTMLRTVDCRSGPWSEHLAEFEVWSEDAADVRATKPLGDMPLIVVSHDPEQGVSTSFDRETNRTWSELQAELSKLSSNSTQVIAKGSGHTIQLDKPDVVIEAIRNVVDECREEAPSTAAK